MFGENFIKVIDQLERVQIFHQSLSDDVKSNIDKKYVADVSLNSIQIASAVAASALGMYYTAMSFIPSAQFAVALAALAYAGAAINLAAATLQSVELADQVQAKNKFNTTDSISNDTKYTST
jgi:hypothetical protein